MKFLARHQAYLRYRYHRLKWRLQQMSSGRLSMVFIDETEPLLDSRALQSGYRTSMQEAREIRHVPVTRFQRPEAVRRTGMSQAIRGQCPILAFRKPVPGEAS